MGVRNSCEIVATNSDLSLFARSRPSTARVLEREGREMRDAARDPRCAA